MSIPSRFFSRNDEKRMPQDQIAYDHWMADRKFIFILVQNHLSADVTPLNTMIFDIDEAMIKVFNVAMIHNKQTDIAYLQDATIEYLKKKWSSHPVQLDVRYAGNQPMPIYSTIRKEIVKTTLR
jgi:hypothetical protein